MLAKWRIVSARRKEGGCKDYYARNEGRVPFFKDRQVSRVYEVLVRHASKG
jgi:hypothetical protein